MRLFRLSLFAGFLYPEAIFRIKTTEKKLCLTFDDGPDPESTPQLLRILQNYNVKGIFFCDGNSAEKHANLIELIKSEGHLIGNHGYSHYNGWITPFKDYISDVESADRFTSDGLFRPPYGRLKLSQYLRLKKRYKIIFWDVMPYDFDNSFGQENSLRILKMKIRQGSIIVFHDKSESCANKILEEFIVFALNKGYRFETSF
jgi:peptidoglycan/xylan/chitin deacetylase (PgdA/CDA1 family)